VEKVLKKLNYKGGPKLPFYVYYFRKIALVMSLRTHLHISKQYLINYFKITTIKEA
jgi:hypothetical protein